MTHNTSLHEQPSNPNEAVMLEMDLEPWNRRMDALMAEDAQIIAFRGAGTINGIKQDHAGEVVGQLRNYVNYVTDSGRPVALVYDGDADNRERPDIGSVFGSLVDALQDNPRVTAIAAQTEGWYSPTSENAPIASATGTPYETYVFSDKLPGSHESLTQSEALAAYPHYEQVVVGPAGQIALRQLSDLSQKASGRPAEAGGVHVTVFETSNNPAVEDDLQAKLSAANDDKARANITVKLEQRHNQPYGALFTATGEFSVDTTQYPGLDFVVVRSNSSK